MKHKDELKEIIKHYSERGAAQDQNELIQLLREVQELYEGVIPHKAVNKIADKLELKMSFIEAIIKRYPSIKIEGASHTLSVCGGKNCSKRGTLATFVEEEYAVKPDGVAAAGFRFKVGGCMKHCGKGPCAKWDGEVYTEMTPKKLRALIEG